MSEIETELPNDPAVGGSLDEIFGADANLQEEGVWADYGKCSIKIAFAGEDNSRYEKEIDNHTKAFRKYMLSAHMKMPKSMEPAIKLAMMRAYSKAVIMDWKGVYDGNKKPIPFSPKECLAAFKRLPAFFRWAREYASDLENYQSDSEETDSEN